MSGGEEEQYLDVVLSPTDVEKFLKEAPDSQYVATKETTVNEGKKHNGHRVFNTYLIPLSKTNLSRTFFEDDGNILRLPDIKKSYEYKGKKKTFKKSPKRTIQKIIKKNKSKVKKLYINQVTTEPAKSSVDIEPYDMIQEEQSQKNDAQTTQATQRKKGRKWNAKHTRYPMPFQKMQPRKDIFRRNRRDTDTGRGLYILEDLDEIEFLSKEDGDDVVRAHVKNYW